MRAIKQTDTDTVPKGEKSHYYLPCTIDGTVLPVRVPVVCKISGPPTAKAVKKNKH